MIAKRNQFIKLTSAVLACAVISACSSSDTGSSLNSGTPSSGDADFSKFVSIGDSLTAGFADGALYLLGQTNSFPNILAQQFADADGVAVNFSQPLATTNFGGFLVNGATGILENRFVLNTETSSPERLAGDPTEDVIGSGLNGMTFNNVGVPGAKSFHLLAPNFGDPAGILGMTANPFFVRFASTTTATVMDDAVAQAPSFYTLWIGNNDVLGFATSGGDGSNPITDPAMFAGAYDGIVTMMKGANPAVQGVLINIPDVSTIPFFTTVPFNAVPLDQATADTLNANPGFVGYNAGLQAAVGVAPGFTQEEADTRTINFVAGQNALLITDDDLFDLSGSGLPSMRHATAADLIILPTSAIIGVEAIPGNPATSQGVTQPLADGDVLTATEVEMINTARTAYNATIKAAADADSNLVHFDAAAVMVELGTTGIDFGTGSVNSDFATGGAFGLDGVHPTGRGYAVIANKIIDVMNTAFAANVHKVDPAGFPTIFLK